MYKVRIMISIFQGMPRKYQDLIHLWQDDLYVSTQFSIDHVYCVKQEVYLSNRPQVSMGYRLINHAGCW